MPPQVQKVVNEKTLLPLSLVFTLVSAIAWLSGLHSDQKRAEATLARLEHELENHDHYIQAVDERLSRIEGKLTLTNNHQKDEP
jgi:hypothetical protein